MKIDSHQHFWRYDPSIDSWITDQMSVIKNDFLPEHLFPLLKEASFDGCVVVQSRQDGEHTNFLLQLAGQNDFIKGVVGWIDLCSPKLEQRLKHYSQFKKLKGFRHVLQAEPSGFMAQEVFINGVNKLHQYNFTYDLLITHEQLKEAVTFTKKIRETKIVVDHLAKPSIKTKEISAWQKEISLLAESSNVFCKISGMVTEADWTTWKQNDFVPYMDAVMETFGPERVMYGSDWPVCLVAASYNQQLGIIKKYFSQSPASVTEKIFGLNAVKFYNLK